MPALSSPPQMRTLPLWSCCDHVRRCTRVSGWFVRCHGLASAPPARHRLLTRRSVDSTRVSASAVGTGVYQPLAGAEYSYLHSVQVLDADGYAIDASSLIPTAADAVTVLVFLTHYADLSSWELAQQLIKAFPTFKAQVYHSLCLRVRVMPVSMHPPYLAMERLNSCAGGITCLRRRTACLAF